ncbi:alpha-ketoacid dehydrogenase subunit beta [Couchioplanes caeruleus]|uniref:Pyruvate dehydrogenase E1 component subunit beta n=2 Tax=Couchioplanes caeruleus TaxID=56438 RepID=A0A1K0GWK6_9ACTN|nr:transketolase C-terminal domain-containing protein [Couchioplanes caeruleus]OJF15764.1 Transketolase E1 beta subunit [Couchioplanes caeruleus subsp. caeruleus]ROP31265.1 pyruvate dehydrogenase E1 component beta subunit [Couchioplanes caeruleus]
MRVAEDLNAALHTLFEACPDLYLLGEDIADPYGGAFKVTKGLSDKHPNRVLPTPLSESGIMGVAGGLALAGDRAIVEVMFGDFIALCFDQIVNFASKSVSMYGQRVPLRLVVRCPVGGNRGYGPTHSQSPQKHFIGVPNLSLYEMSPFHDNATVFRRMLDHGEPAVFFEDKILYTRPMYADGHIDDVLRYDLIGDPSVARVHIEDPDDFRYVVIAPGGLAHRVMGAMRTLFLQEEIPGLLLVPSRLYPFDVEPLLPILARAEHIIVAEESVAGGTWGSEVAQSLYSRLWGMLRHPIRLVNSADSIIPTAAHLEHRVLVQENTVYDTLREACA